MSDLFTHAERRETATRLRDTGMALAAEAQDNAVPNWSALAYMAILAVARVQDTVHQNDIAKIFPHQPAHPNAWGQPWRRAIKDGAIERTGELRACEDARKHRHNSPVYRSRIRGQS